jgi:hypothetical protein
MVTYITKGGFKPTDGWLYTVHCQSIDCPAHPGTATTYWVDGPARWAARMVDRANDISGQPMGLRIRVALDSLFPMHMASIENFWFVVSCNGPRVTDVSVYTASLERPVDYASVDFKRALTEAANMCTGSREALPITWGLEPRGLFTVPSMHRLHKSTESKCLLGSLPSTSTCIVCTARPNVMAPGSLDVGIDRAGCVYDPEFLQDRIGGRTRWRGVLLRSDIQVDVLDMLMRLIMGSTLVITPTRTSCTETMAICSKHHTTLVVTDVERLDEDTVVVACITDLLENPTCLRMLAHVESVVIVGTAYYPTNDFITLLALLSMMNTYVDDSRDGICHTVPTIIATAEYGSPAIPIGRHLTICYTDDSVTGVRIPDDIIFEDDNIRGLVRRSTLTFQGSEVPVIDGARDRKITLSRYPNTQLVNTPSVVQVVPTVSELEAFTRSSERLATNRIRAILSGDAGPCIVPKTVDTLVAESGQALLAALRNQPDDIDPTMECAVRALVSDNLQAVDMQSANPNEPLSAAIRRTAMYQKNLREAIGTQCPVCMCDPTDTIVRQCGHVYCHHCVRKLKACAVCRGPIRDEKNHLDIHMVSTDDHQSIRPGPSSLVTSAEAWLDTLDDSEFPCVVVCASAPVARAVSNTSGYASTRFRGDTYTHVTPAEYDQVMQPAARHLVLGQLHDVELCGLTRLADFRSVLVLGVQETDTRVVDCIVGACNRIGSTPPKTHIVRIDAAGQTALLG